MIGPMHTPVIILVVFLVTEFAVASLIASKYGPQSALCGPTELTALDGSISSPNYPSVYPNDTSCTWVINSLPGTVLTIRIIDFDIEEDANPNCNSHPCCIHNWLSLPKEGGRGSQQLCGHKILVKPVSVSQETTNIKFRTSKVIKGGRGFRLTYSTEMSLERLPCPAGETRCQDGDGCGKRCDSKLDCSDFSDEIDCGYCGEGQVMCGFPDKSCFSPRSDRCNGKFECPYGEDEVGCSKSCAADKLACANGEGCYDPSERCNSKRNCHDESDETNCPPCTALNGKFLCDDGLCISDLLSCNGVANCPDRSDETSCLKNSVVTAAILGSLVCGLLLVVAVGCLCRLYGVRITSTRQYQMHQEDIMPTRHPDEEFFHREPPPAYSVTDTQQLQRLPPLHVSVHAPGARYPNHRSRSSRRHASCGGGGGRRRARLPPPPLPAFPAASVPATAETAMEAAASRDKARDDTRLEVSSSSSSSTESPSRGSVTSSTSVMSASGNEDTQLLIA